MSFILLVVAFGQLVRSQFLDSSNPPAQMTGLFNVAVAPFGVAGAQGDDERTRAVASSIAQAAYRGVRKSASSETQVWSPAQTQSSGALGDPPTGRSLPALARKINADVLVYGDLHDGLLRSTIAPKLYVAPGLLPGAEELVGGFALGAPVVSAGSALANPTTRGDLAKGLRKRMTALTEFVVGLGYLHRNQFNESRRHFKSALSSLAGAEGRELAYLFIASTSAELGQYDEASADYARALELRPGYARARLGLAEVLFQRGKGDCTGKTIDLELLGRARAQYAAARSSAASAPLADVPTKASLGLGRVEVCVAQSGNGDGWGAARTHLHAVIDDYDRGNGRVRELAAQAYAALAIVDAPLAGAPDAKERYGRAIADLQAALRLTTNPKHESDFSKALRHFTRRAGSGR